MHSDEDFIGHKRVYKQHLALMASVSHIKEVVASQESTGSSSDPEAIRASQVQQESLSFRSNLFRNNTVDQGTPPFAACSSSQSGLPPGSGVSLSTSNLSGSNPSVYAASSTATSEGQGRLAGVFHVSNVNRLPEFHNNQPIHVTPNVQVHNLGVAPNVFPPQMPRRAGLRSQPVYHPPRPNALPTPLDPSSAPPDDNHRLLMGLASQLQTPPNHSQSFTQSFTSPLQPSSTAASTVSPVNQPTMMQDLLARFPVPDTQLQPTAGSFQGYSQPILPPQVPIFDHTGVRFFNHVALALKLKIMRGEYVDFALLQKEATMASLEPMQLSISDEGTLVRSKPSKRIDGFHKWLRSWRCFVAIYVATFPHALCQLMQYESNIHNYSARFKWDAVYGFDIRARMDQAADPSLPWSASRQDLFDEELIHAPVDVSLQRSRTKFTSGSTFNPSSSVPSSSYQQNANAKSAQPKRSNGNNASTAPKQLVCFDYNRSACNREAGSCKYPHNCAYCFKPGHISGNCRSTGQNKQSSTSTQNRRFNR